MIDYILKDKTNLVNHLFYKLSDASAIKIQKTLYFLFAFYGATYGELSGDGNVAELESVNYTKFLFKPNFEAWKYGPVDIDVYTAYRNDQYEAVGLTEDKLNEKLTPSEKRNVLQFIDSIIQQTDEVDDFTLIDRTREDDAWHNSFEEKDGEMHRKMNPQVIVDEYAQKYV